MTKKYTSQDRPPWPQTDIILPLIRSGRGLHGVSFRQHLLGLEGCWVCACAEESAAACVPACPLSLIRFRHITPLCLCLPSCRLAAGLIHLTETPDGTTDGPNLPSTTQWHMSFLSTCCLAWERQAPCSSSVLPVHQLVASRRFSVLYMNARSFSSKMSSL